MAQGVDDPQTKYYAAVAHALRGDRERAVKYLEATFEKMGALNRRRVAIDPDLESVRAELMERRAV